MPYIGTSPTAPIPAHPTPSPNSESTVTAPPSSSVNYMGKDYAAIASKLNGNSFSALARKCYYKTVGDTGLKNFLSRQYDVLATHSTTLKDFFPENRPEYKNDVLSHQAPFFKAYFTGSVTAKQLESLDKAHHGYSRALGATVRISNEQVDEMKRVIDDNTGFLEKTFVRPSDAIEIFRPLIVSE